MKRYIWTFILCFFCLIVSAQTRYEVTANTFLNIRSYASTDAPVLGTINKGGEVDVYEIADGWAKIAYDGGYAYVSSEYLKKSESNPMSNPESKSFGISIFMLDIGNVKWMVFLILGLSVGLFTIRKYREEEFIGDKLLITNWILFLAVCIIELIYMSAMGDNAIWFCKPEKVGWLWTIISFLLFGGIVYNQINCFLDALADVKKNSGGDFDARLGIYSWAGFAISGIISGIFFPVALPFIYTAFIICQIIQIVLIFKGIVPYGGWRYAFLSFAIYLLGSFATIAITIQFVVLLLLVIIAGFLLKAFANSGNSSRGCCRSCRYSSGNYCNHFHNYIDDPDGTTCRYYDY